LVAIQRSFPTTFDHYADAQQKQNQRIFILSCRSEKAVGQVCKDGSDHEQCDDERGDPCAQTHNYKYSGYNIKHRQRIS
jgi:hypothetical protein